MNQNFTKTLMSVLFIFLFSMPFQAIGNKTSSQKEELKDYMQVDYFVRRKLINKYTEFVQIYCKDLKIRIIEYTDTLQGGDYKSLIKFLINDKEMSNSWLKSNFNDEEEELKKILTIYSNGEGKYFILFGGLYGSAPAGNYNPDLELYNVSMDKVQIEGNYLLPVKYNIDDITLNENPYRFYSVGNFLKLELIDINNKKYDLDNYNREKDNEPIDKSLLRKADDFDWEMAFSPSVYYKEFFSYDDRSIGTYKIDWNKREISPLNDIAKHRDIHLSFPKFHFSKDTFIIEDGFYDNNQKTGKITGFYFLKSDTLNDVILNKIIVDKIPQNDIVLDGEHFYDSNVRDIYNDLGIISLHDFNEQGSPYKTDSFPLENYSRNFGLDELLKVVINKKKEYIYNP